MTIKQRLQKIDDLQSVKTPWHVMRLFGQVQLWGPQISFEQGNSDFVELEEAKQALEWLVEQLGGRVNWSAVQNTNDTKKEAK